MMIDYDYYTFIVEHYDYYGCVQGLRRVGYLSEKTAKIVFVFVSTPVVIRVDSSCTQKRIKLYDM